MPAGPLSSPDQLFYFDYGTTIWTFVTFAIVLLILWWKVWPPLARSLDKRVEKIRSDLERAEQASTHAEEASKTAAEIISKARTAAQDIVNQSRTTASELRENLMREARSESERIRAEGEAAVIRSREAAEKDFKNGVADLSLLIASKIMRKSLRPEDHKTLIHQSIDDYRQNVENTKTGTTS